MAWKEARTGASVDQTGGAGRREVHRFAEETLELAIESLETTRKSMGQRKVGERKLLPF